MNSRENSCTGFCDSCGKCKGAKILKTMNEHKAKLFFMPKDFVADKRGKMGIAFDIGTTTVVGNLWSLENGESLQTIGKTNPQKIVGPDVISRIQYCSDSPEKFKEIRELILACMNEMIEEFLRDNQLAREDLVRVTVAGNTTMSHIFAGFNPKSLAYAPFAPAYTGEKEFFAPEIPLNLGAKTRVILLPNIAGHIGGDITAGILATRLKILDGLNLFIDIGTNGEIVLAKDGKMIGCSTAAGPAFEGSSIYQGMRAETGAIETVQIKEGTVYFNTIENGEPVGICGSGIIQAVAEMLKAGIVNKSGRLLLTGEHGETCLSEDLNSRLREGITGREFVLVFKKGTDDVVITQKDIREVQLAKGAISAGILLLLKEFGENVANLNRIIVAGAFGSTIDPESSLTIGLLPEVPIGRIISAGNAAGSGASLVLLSEEERKKAARIAAEAAHLELADQESFQEEFLKSMSFN